MSETLGLILVRSGVVSREDLYQALEVQRQTGRYLGSCLIALELVTPEQLRSALSQQLGVEQADGRAVLAADEALASEIPAEVVERYRVVPFSLSGNTLQIAFYDPGTADSLSEISFFTGCTISALLCDEAVVERTIARLYPQLARIMAPLPQTSPPSATAPQTPAPDRRRPAELIRPVEEISNRDFAQALGLEELTAEPATAPIPLARRKAAAVREVRGSALLSIVEAAEQIFEAKVLADIAEISVRFLRSFFDRAIAFDLTVQPSAALVRSGFLVAVERLDVQQHSVIAEVIRGGLSFHGSAPRDGAWTAFFAELGDTSPGSILIASVRDQQRPRLLFYADTQREESYEDVHETALLVREVATALSLQNR